MALAIAKGVAGRGSRTKGREGGGSPAEGRKKKKTSIDLMVEVVSDIPVATSDGFSRVGGAS